MTQSLTTTPLKQLIQLASSSGGVLVQLPQHHDLAASIMYIDPIFADGEVQGFELQVREAFRARFSAFDLFNLLSIDYPNPESLDDRWQAELPGDDPDQPLVTPACLLDGQAVEIDCRQTEQGLLLHFGPDCSLLVDRQALDGRILGAALQCWKSWGSRWI